MKQHGVWSLLSKGLVLIPLLTLCGCIMGVPVSTGDYGKPSAVVVQPAESFWNSNQILVISISGVLFDKDPGMFSSEPSLLVGLKDRLDKARRDPSVKAIILKINSPGGSVTVADLMYQEIMAFKQEKKIPVIALLMDVAASGGFYIAMAADVVYALPTTTTGSIGVICLLPNATGLSEKIGFTIHAIKTGEHKDAGSPWRELSESDQQIFQEMINDYYERFLDITLTGRHMAQLSREQLLKIADGRVLTASQALEAKLIDVIGYPDAVIEHAKLMAQIKDAEVISYEYGHNGRNNIYAQSPLSAFQMNGLGQGDLNLFKIDLGGFSSASANPGFYYLWAH